LKKKVGTARTRATKYITERGCEQKARGSRQSPGQINREKKRKGRPCGLGEKEKGRGQLSRALEKSRNAAKSLLQHRGRRTRDQGERK